MTTYRNNHYVPVWYQQRFIPEGHPERKFYYLDMRPDTIVANGRTYRRNAILRWGPKSCFSQDDLYTTKFAQWISTEIEEKFFGPVDGSAHPAIDYFDKFAHPSADGELFNRLVRYMSLQRLRTPKGLAHLSELTKQISPNDTLFELQRLRDIHCAIWTESVWSIADASGSTTKFLLSDHPVTVYNKGCFPESSWCRGYRDPHIWLTGTHTLFPLSLEKILILTNLSWVRYPYGNPTALRPNPNPFRPAMFKFTDIQVGRRLTEQEVTEVNYIIKRRAHRYIAAIEKSWLYPENALHSRRWDRFGDDYLLMPDPRSVSFSSEIVIGYENRKADFFDAYGRKPWQPDYDDKSHQEREWETFHAFQGEFARRFGPQRRGVSFEFGSLPSEVDSDDHHKYHLDLEQKHKKHRYNPKRSRA